MALATWRLVLAPVLAALAYVLSKPVMEALLGALRRRVARSFRWIADVQRYMLLYLSWICFALLLISIARYVLLLEDDSVLVDALQDFLALAVVLGTFSLRRVLSNVIVRHFEWDQDVTEFGPRIFVVTEGVNSSVFVLMAIEVFYIFFVDDEMAQFLLVLVLGCMELLWVLAGFTTLKNVATGLFLIFAEPFRVGSECKVRDLRGFIERVSLARTTLRRHDGALTFVPNGVFADWHQTSGSAQDAQLHELVLRLHATTPIDKIQRLVDELTAILPQFAVADDAVALAVAAAAAAARARSSRESDSVATPRSVQVPPPETRSFASTVDARVADERNSGFRVVLCAMYRVKVSVRLDRSRFASLEAAKTEVRIRHVAAGWSSGLA
ncbi:hypothetical protein PybrP1_012927 [[Pythium] brassicae (nom. inval.)]|nr:hypothetical protein PybrP1_012927 [[Pythium] brassicae (nom. inval.)]